MSPPARAPAGVVHGALCTACGAAQVLATGLGASPARQLRCTCGSLLGRQVPAGIEVKCRRCKHAVVLRIDPAPAGAPLDPRTDPDP